MRKHFCLLFVLFLLIGCGPSGGEPAADTQSATSTPSILATEISEAAAEPTAVEETAAASDEASSDEVSSDEVSSDEVTDEVSDEVSSEVSAAYSPATSVDEAAVVRQQDWVRGAAEPAVTLIEYGDFQWPGCAALTPVLEQLVTNYPDQVQLVYRHFPLTIHDNAQKAAEAAEIAGAQGEFWLFHDALFEDQSEWAGLDEATFREFLIDMADDLGLEVDSFTADLDAGSYTEYVSSSFQEAVNLNLPGTPAVIFNGILLTGDQLPPFEYWIWDAYVQLALLEERQYESAPEMMIDPEASYLARVEMESGEEFVIELLPQSAPQTVNSFVFLAQEGWFDGMTFHRVLPGFVAQTGDPSGTGAGSPGYTLPDEIDPALSHAESGVVAMANSGSPNSSGSQWYITLGDASQLDGQYTIFGRVIEGMEVVEGITPRNPAENPELPPGDKIVAITIEEQE